MKFVVFTVFCVSTLFLEANTIFLEDVMDREEQKKTGVSKLTTQQKIELENWINRTFVLKTDNAPAAPVLSLSINVDGGKKLRLSDNSLWEVDPADVSQAAGWLLPIPLTIEPSGNPEYPYYLVNPQAQERIKVKKLSS